MSNTTSIDELINLAITARKLAYAPYSNFSVGCSILLKPNLVLTGCNIENMSYGMTICAERVAFYNAIMQYGFDYLRDNIQSLVIVADTIQPITPCGACLQTYAELQTDFEIVLANLDDKIRIMKFTELLPYTFKK